MPQPMPKQLDGSLKKEKEKLRILKELESGLDSNREAIRILNEGEKEPAFEEFIHDHDTQELSSALLDEARQAYEAVEKQVAKLPPSEQEEMLRELVKLSNPARREIIVKGRSLGKKAPDAVEVMKITLKYLSSWQKESARWERQRDKQNKKLKTLREKAIKEERKSRNESRKERKSRGKGSEKNRSRSK
jgi:geranylgeranyl pyrophosphate synthase